MVCSEWVIFVVCLLLKFKDWKIAQTSILLLTSETIEMTKLSSTPDPDITTAIRTSFF